MSLPQRLAPLVALVAALAAGACVYPTEHDADVHVSVTPLPILIRGNDTLATARAWQLVGTGDSVEITNVSFVWSSGNSAVATVDPNGHIVGIKSGTTTIRAAAANFDKRSQPGDITLRVAERLEIDSIRPKTVHFGDTVTVFGVGVDSIFQAQLAQGVLIPNVFRRSRDATGYARSVYWVPPPAHKDSLFYIGYGVFGFSKDVVQVILLDHLHHVLREPEHAVADVEQRVLVRGRRHPVDAAGVPGRIPTAPEDIGDQDPLGQLRLEDRVHPDPEHGDGVAEMHRLGPDAVDLEPLGDPQRDITGLGALVEVRRGGADRRRAGLDAHDVPAGVHRRHRRIAAGPDEADVRDLSGVAGAEHLPGAGRGQRVVPADQDRERRDADVHIGIVLGGVHARARRERGDEGDERGQALWEAHAGTIRVSRDSIYSGPYPGAYDRSHYSRPRRFRSRYPATTACAARSGGTSSTSTPARRMWPSASSRARSSSSAAALRKASVGVSGRNAATRSSSG